MTFACRSCRSGDITSIVDFGDAPLADDLITEDQLTEPTRRFPLHLVMCQNCSLVQLAETPPPDLLFGRDYLYLSSLSATLNMEAERFAHACIANLDLGAGSKVLEIASNDGYLLRHFKNASVDVLGVEPAPVPAEKARQIGIETRSVFFDHATAKKLRHEHGLFDLIVANNVLAHVPDPNEFLRGVKHLLATTGSVSIECGYAGDLFESLAFDTIYHEHHSYFSLHALMHLFEANELAITHVEHIVAQGGSLRVTAQHRHTAERCFNSKDHSVSELMHHESETGLASGAAAANFADRMGQRLQTLDGCLRDLEAQGKQITAYGAAAKGTMLLNALHKTGSGVKSLHAVCDKNAEKQGRHIPGIRLPVISVEEMRQSQPDVVLILPWNLAPEIIKQESALLQGGTQFIVPLPELRVYNRDHIPSFATGN